MAERFVFKRLPEEAAHGPFEPGHWYRPEGASAVYVVCPRCGTRHLLRHGVWTIAADGTVNPSIHCQHQRRCGGVPISDPCGFHEFVRLEGWTPPT